MSRLIVALDYPSLDTAERVARSITEHVGGFKVGMELLMGEGPAAIETINRLGRHVFADAKLHDIPNTVERAAERIRSAGARWVTVHGGGGLEMIQAARTGMGGSGVLVVTMLTSLSEIDLTDLGISGSVDDQVARMTRLAVAAQAEGVVCSPGEIEVVKTAGPGLKVFTPGVRPEESTTDDQKRVSTPEDAMRRGADYLVVGRPITRADDPAESARKIAASIASFR